MSFSDVPFLAFPRLRLERPTVAVVGAGPSAILTAVHLLRRRAPIRVVLVGVAPPLGRGATSSPLEWCLEEEVAAGRRRTPFTAIRGRVTAVATGPDGAIVRLAGGETLWASQVVLDTDDPGEITLEAAFGVGSAVDDDGRLLDRSGDPSPVLWALAPLGNRVPPRAAISERAAALAQLVPEAALALELSYALEEA